LDSGHFSLNGHVFSGKTPLTAVISSTKISTVTLVTIEVHDEVRMYIQVLENNVKMQPSSTGIGRRDFRECTVGSPPPVGRQTKAEEKLLNEIFTKIFTKDVFRGAGLWVGVRTVSQ
jgi:hypothetical protein